MYQAFGGTCSIGTQALQLMTVELVRSIRTWGGRVALVDGHGGHRDALRAAVSQLRGEGHDVAWAPCATPETDRRWDAHAASSRRR